MKVSLHFTTTKNQTIEDIKFLITKANIEKLNVTLVHCFLPRDVILAKGFDTSVVDYLHELGTKCVFSGNLDTINEEREQMINDVDACLFVGNITAGVAIEYDMAQKAGKPILMCPSFF